MKNMMLIAALVFAAPFAYAETEMANDAAVAADANADTAAAATAEAIEVVDKGTQAATDEQALSQVKTDAAVK